MRRRQHDQEKPRTGGNLGEKIGIATTIEVESGQADRERYEGTA